jgi:hypothetical protein
MGAAIAERLGAEQGVFGSLLRLPIRRDHAVGFGAQRPQSLAEAAKDGPRGKPPMTPGVAVAERRACMPRFGNIIV